MARLPFRSRRRAAAADGASAAAPRRPPPPAAQLRRERRALLRLREERIRDLGGLVLEMHRQEAFREELVYERCADLAALEDRLSELDSILSAASAPRRSSRGARCECGAPVLWGSHFCANCGRTVGDAPAVACMSCGAGMPAEARFCATCGHPVEPTQAPEPAAS
jgi:uncharacterized protein YjiS (DUF1127 family)